MIALWSQEVAQFIEDYSLSESHRLMFFLGQVTVKVCGMFELTIHSEIPEAAREAAALLLAGMMSGDAAVYSERHTKARAIYNEWHARRGVH